jgi:inner membrane protein
MPSALGHSLLGYLIYTCAPKSIGVRRWRLPALYILAANAPDLDFIPGLLVGHPDRYHHGISHSIGFAVLFALIINLSWFVLKRDISPRNFIVLFSLYCSHNILDYFSIDDSFPYGLPFFWPLSSEYYIAPFAFLPGIKRVSSSNLDFISSLFSAHNFSALAVESILFLPLLLLVFFLKRKINTYCRNSYTNNIK